MTALSPKCLKSHSDIWIHLQGLMTLECILLRTVSAMPIDFKSEKLVCGECSLITFSSKLKLRIEKALKAKHILNRLLVLSHAFHTGLLFKCGNKVL